MSQEKLWLEEWKGVTKKLPPNNFARRMYRLITKKHKNLLDLGCGNGRDSVFFASKGLEVTTVDWSKSGLEQIQKLVDKKKITNLKTVQQDISKLTFKANSFDIIYAHLSLHYFDDNTTTKIFNTLHSLLKKGGLLFVKCKSVEDALYGHGIKLEENMYNYRGHVRHFFDKEYLKSKLSVYTSVQIRKSSSVYHRYKSSFVEAVAKK